ncbi:MAG: FprA family A-type flavoprotein [Clostridia bacterium]|nr:FprA family A-type flavoprotein [Clostridia bacterium]MBR6553901.1 FprA family A-type flavoprotein [Clostridia bacterium]
MFITNDIRYIGVNDKKIDLFEGQYPVPKGMSYNSYAILDEKIAIMDTVDAAFTKEWLANLQSVLGDRGPDYLVVQHMEPDHSANILNFIKAYPNVTVVASAKAFAMMQNFFGTSFEEQRLVVGEGSVLELGKHTLTFYTAPMVHWPEVIVTYDSCDKVLFSADGFGKFGTWDADEPWEDEARRYYFGIVGKYGTQVQALLKKAAGLDIAMICPLHGPVLRENLAHYLHLYDRWSSYTPEEPEGITIAYTSVYGNTRKAVMLLADKLAEKGCEKIVIHDLARCDMTAVVADAFRYGKLVLATTTYNADIFPFMRTFITHLTERNFQNRTVALMENGSWAPMAAKVMGGMLEKSKNLTFTETTVKITSALGDDSISRIEKLAEELW